MAQQMAVEWLESTFYTYAESFGINNDKWGINELKLEDILAIAKQMEKEQIIKAATLPREQRGYNALKYNNCGEQYYSETYEK